MPTRSLLRSFSPPASGRGQGVGLPDYGAQILEHAVDIVSNVIVPVADDTVPLALQEPGPSVVRPAFTVLTPINFDDQLELTAHEVADERPDWHLTREFPTIELPIAEITPKSPFGGRRGPAELLSPFGGSSHRFGH